MALGGEHLGDGARLWKSLARLPGFRERPQMPPGIGSRLLLRAPNNAGNAMSPLGEAVRVRHAQPAFGINARN